MPRAFSVIFIILMIAIVACSQSEGTENDGQLQQDASLREIFINQELAFENLLKMLRDDKHLWRVGFDLAYVDTPIGTPPRTPTSEELPAVRWDEYRRLFRALGLANGITREWEGETEAIYLPVDVVPRGAVDSEEKGFVYRPVIPEPLLETLDAPKLPVRHAQPGYARLKGRWYLYRRYNE